MIVLPATHVVIEAVCVYDKPVEPHRPLIP